MEKLLGSRLSTGECNCCHRRSDKIVDGDGRCLNCINEPEIIIIKWTQGQREFTIANVNTIIGALVILFINEFTGYPANPIIQQIIMWFTYLTILSILIIYIYNWMKKV